MINIIRQSVQSSNIASIGYDKLSQTLEVEFINASIYQYFNVPIGKYLGIMGAASKGSYLADEIKDIYSYRRVG